MTDRLCNNYDDGVPISSYAVTSVEIVATDVFRARRLLFISLVENVRLSAAANESGVVINTRNILIYFIIYLQHVACRWLNISAIFY